jgi:hypothetical protein
MRTSTAVQASTIPLDPARTRPAAPGPGSGRLAIWYVVFAGYAGLVAIFSGPGDDRSWGIWAAAAYAAAALAAARWRSYGRDAALVASLAGALVIPLAWLAAHAPATPDVLVVSRSAALLLAHGTPYLSGSQLGPLAGPIAYNPYLPAMAVFGLPRALGVQGLAGDPRLWLGATSVVLLTLAFRVAGRREALRCSLFAVASPAVAFPLALGITDPPVLALMCLALALLSQRSRTLALWPAAIALGAACAMKATAWPALAVLAAMLAARDGAREAARFIIAAVATTAVVVVALAPAILAGPAVMIQNTVLFPLGLTHIKTPAESPLPGHLLAMIGPDGRLAAIGLLIAAGLAIAVSLVVRPPADGAAAARRLALGLTLMFALSPATRLGYFAYPIGLYGWLALRGRGARAARELRPAADLRESGTARTGSGNGASAEPARHRPASRAGRSARFGGLLDRGESHRDAFMRSLRAIGNLGISVVTEPFVEHGDTVGEELP